MINNLLNFLVIALYVFLFVVIMLDSREIRHKLDNFKKEAITLHYAEHNSTNGNWQWIKNK